MPYTAAQQDAVVILYFYFESSTSAQVFDDRNSCQKEIFFQYSEPLVAVVGNERGRPQSANVVVVKWTPNSFTCYTISYCCA